MCCLQNNVVHSSVLICNNTNSYVAIVAATWNWISTHFILCYFNILWFWILPLKWVFGSERRISNPIAQQSRELLLLKIETHLCTKSDVVLHAKCVSVFSIHREHTMHTMKQPMFWLSKTTMKTKNKLCLWMLASVWKQTNIGWNHKIIKYASQANPNLLYKSHDLYDCKKEIVCECYKSDCWNGAINCIDQVNNFAILYTSQDPILVGRILWNNMNLI